MKKSNNKIQNLRPVFFVLLLAFGLSASFAQSTNQGFPTPVTTNEISGTIKARDLGDARLTSYFYVFNGNQGDIFINVVTKNLDGDIDIFTADNLRPLTKITVYSDNPDSETGRVIYLRQPQKLILRIEGKTPTDEPASFRIKFAGSFAAIEGAPDSTEAERMPEVKADENGEVRVNSVGTIISVKPKPTPTPKPTTAKVEKTTPKKEEKKTESKKEEDESTEIAGNREKKENPDDAENREKKPEVIVTENLPEKKEETAPTPKGTVAEKEKPKKKPVTNKPVKPKTPKTPTVRETKPKTAENPEKKSEPAAVDPAQLENIRLIVVFKDGTKIERPMSEILKVSVDKGILTVISKDGEIGRYSILDIVKMTIE